MKKTEQKALDWLMKSRDVTQAAISYQRTKSPTFVLSNGERFEVKRLYSNKIIMYETRWEQIKCSDCSILVFNSMDDPIAQIPVREINPEVKSWNNIEIMWVGHESAKIRIPRSLSEEIAGLVGPGSLYADASEFVKEAVREKITKMKDARYG